jgi:hypothetical protein
MQRYFTFLLAVSKAYTILYVLSCYSASFWNIFTHDQNFMVTTFQP